MRCPKCGNLEDKVIDSRSAKAGAAIRRRRECLACQHRFTTYEEIERRDLRVIKRDGRHEPFDRQKLLSGMIKACEKRPVSFVLELYTADPAPSVELVVPTGYRGVVDVDVQARENIRCQPGQRCCSRRSRPAPWPS